MRKITENGKSAVKKKKVIIKAEADRMSVFLSGKNRAAGADSDLPFSFAGSSDSDLYDRVQPEL